MVRTLGLDLGTNSVGWGLVDEDSIDKSGSIVASGVRIFHEAVDAQSRTPKNAQRRSARLARRILQRRARRRASLRSQLAKAGFLPKDMLDSAEQESHFNMLGDPYELRKRALDHPLESYELGRVLLHICARRGFMSNRKIRWGDLRDDPDAKEFIDEIAQAERAKDEGEKSDDTEESAVLGEIAAIWKKLNGGEARTLGEYLANLPKGARRRGRHTDRGMYEDEFEKIWIAQGEYHPDLTDGLKAELHRTIFHQRPLKLRGGRIGMCSLEPNRPRTAKARLEFQRFRLLQDVNNLAVVGQRDGASTPLSQDQRDKLAAALEVQQTMTWSKIRSTVGLPKTAKFNLELDGSKGRELTGNTTAARLRSLAGDWWGASDDGQRIALVEDLTTIQSKKVLYRRLKEFWGFERTTAFELATIEFEEGYGDLSLKALRKLLPYMEWGKIYSDARKDSGYTYASPSVSGDAELLGPPPSDLRNPVVEKALHEVRKVVNAIIREYGKPDIIRVEMARDLKMSRKDKANLQKQQRQNQDMNREAERALADIGIQASSRDDLIKFRLWRESDERCPYTGKVINIHELFSPAVDVEHIIPFSRSLDDSFRNKTLCMAEENRLHKRNRTPWEAYGATESWQEMVARVPARKRKWFQQKDDEVKKLLENFESRQLNDTRYISRDAKEYLKTLGRDVDVTKGGMTGALRHAWGLNRFLAGDSPTDDAVAEKNRADNRHHAIDAIVVAVTTRSLYQRMARSAREIDQTKQQASLIESAKEHAPWEGFDRDIEQALSGIAVSHASLRKLHGAFHEDTAFGYRYVKDAGKKQFVYRKRLEELTSSMVKRIVDPILRQGIKRRIEDADSIKEAFGNPDQPFYHPKNPNGQPVRRVRISENKSETQLYGVDRQLTREGKPFKYHALGSNHHVEIFRNLLSGKAEARFVSMMEAANRARRQKVPMINREWEEHEFLMSLAIDEMVELGDGGVGNLYRVQVLDPIGNRAFLRHHLAATLEDNSERVIASVNVLIGKRKGRKVVVSPLGSIRPAND
ncbi:MAG: type II CRISPR RNA-guided endonuclease Cas9 [Chloroflexi bacterium]|nr:type II CRISPR RNA-guided endonuclease Cas9 [Chloroflexota bacterium]